MVDSSSTLTVQPRKNYSFSLKPEIIEAFKLIDEAVLRSGYIGEFAGFEQWKPDFTNWLEF